MSKDILIALITGIISATATILSVIITSNKNNALQDERIGRIKEDIVKLTEHVEKHNNFGLQLAKLEQRVLNLEKIVNAK